MNHSEQRIWNLAENTLINHIGEGITDLVRKCGMPRPRPETSTAGSSWQTSDYRKDPARNQQDPLLRRSWDILRRLPNDAIVLLEVKATDWENARPGKPLRLCKMSGPKFEAQLQAVLSLANAGVPICYAFDAEPGVLNGADALAAVQVCEPDILHQRQAANLGPQGAILREWIFALLDWRAGEGEIEPVMKLWSLLARAELPFDHVATAHMLLIFAPGRLYLLSADELRAVHYAFKRVLKTKDVPGVERSEMEKFVTEVSEFLIAAEQARDAQTDPNDGVIWTPPDDDDEDEKQGRGPRL